MGGHKTIELSGASRRFLRIMQRNELTEHLIYKYLGEHMPPGQNRDILLVISGEEKKHAELWGKYLHGTPEPSALRARAFCIISRIFGFTFMLKLMENREARSREAYAARMEEIPEAMAIAEDERRHEEKLLAMLDEDRLKYVGAMVLGLNDALVELTGALAGLTFALRDTRLVALSGLITGISAALSMGSSEYLSARADGNRNAAKSSFYTGSIYLVTVALLVAPYLLFPRDMAPAALGVMLATVVVIIAGFTWYMSVTKNLPFKTRFLEMAGISLSVATISFLIGILVSRALGV